MTDCISDGNNHQFATVWIKILRHYDVINDFISRIRVNIGSLVNKKMHLNFFGNNIQNKNVACKPIYCKSVVAHDGARNIHTDSATSKGIQHAID